MGVFGNLFLTTQDGSVTNLTKNQHYWGGGGGLTESTICTNPLPGHPTRPTQLLTTQISTKTTDCGQARVPWPVVSFSSGMKGDESSCIIEIGPDSKFPFPDDDSKHCFNLYFTASVTEKYTNGTPKSCKCPSGNTYSIITTPPPPPTPPPPTPTCFPNGSCCYQKNCPHNAPWNCCSGTKCLWDPSGKNMSCQTSHAPEKSQCACSGNTPCQHNNVGDNTCHAYYTGINKCPAGTTDCTNKIK